MVDTVSANPASLELEGGTWKTYRNGARDGENEMNQTARKSTGSKLHNMDVYTGRELKQE